MRTRIRRSWSVRRASRSSSSGSRRSRSSSLLRRARVEQRLAGGDAADGVDDVGAADLLQEIARCAGHDRLRTSASSSENDVSMRQATSGCRERTSRHTSTPLPSGRRTSRIATSGRVGGMRASACSGRSRLADDLEVVLGLEELPHPSPDDLVVVEEEHPHRRSGHWPQRTENHQYAEITSRTREPSRIVTEDPRSRDPSRGE